MLRSHGLEVIELPLPDHHDFRALPWPVTTGDVVVTEKDAVKIDPAQRIGSRIWVATLDFDPSRRSTRRCSPCFRPPPAPSASEPHGNPPA
jgi:tetraacyldisaccharide 4'-kinase